MSLKTYDKLTIIGKAGKNAEMRFFPNGTQVTKFSVACDRSYKDKNTGEWVNRTIWYNCEVFGKLAEIANERINKGSAVMVYGELNPDPETGGPRQWTRQDGSTGTGYDVRVDSLVFLDKRENGEGHDQPAQMGGFDEDSVPF